MIRTYVGAKIHGINVTGKSVQYNGSVSICRELMKLAGIEPYEQVHIVNLNNGNRWITYAVPHEKRGTFTLNGGGARLGEMGDQCVVMTYVQGEAFWGAQVVFCNTFNEPVKEMQYARD